MIPARNAKAGLRICDSSIFKGGGKLVATFALGLAELALLVESDREHKSLGLLQVVQFHARMILAAITFPR